MVDLNLQVRPRSPRIQGRFHKGLFSFFHEGLLEDSLWISGREWPDHLGTIWVHKGWTVGWIQWETFLAGTSGKCETNEVFGFQSFICQICRCCKRKLEFLIDDDTLLSDKVWKSEILACTLDGYPQIRVSGKYWCKKWRVEMLLVFQAMMMYGIMP